MRKTFIISVLYIHNTRNYRVLYNTGTAITVSVLRATLDITDFVNHAWDAYQEGHKECIDKIPNTYNILYTLPKGV